MMFDAILIVAFALSCISGGWYLRGKFGAKVAADVVKVETTAKTL